MVQNLIFTHGHALVCNKLSFVHPITNKKLVFELKDAFRNFEYFLKINDTNTDNFF